MVEGSARARRLSGRAELAAILDELRRGLAETPVRAIALYLAERLGCAGDDRFRIEYEVSQGGVGRFYLHRGPMKTDELGDSQG